MLLMGNMSLRFPKSSGLCLRPARQARRLLLSLLTGAAGTALGQTLVGEFAPVRSPLTGITVSRALRPPSMNLVRGDLPLLVFRMDSTIAKYSRQGKSPCAGEKFDGLWLQNDARAYPTLLADVRRQGYKVVRQRRDVDGRRTTFLLRKGAAQVLGAWQAGALPQSPFSLLVLCRPVSN